MAKSPAELLVPGRALTLSGVADGAEGLIVADLARKLDELEKKYDAQFKVVFDAIRELMTPPEPQRRQIGFHSHE